MPSDRLPNPYAPPAAAPASFSPGGAIARYETQTQSVWVLILLAIVTLGIYPSVWFILRRRFLDSLDAGVKLGAFAYGPLAATLLSIALGFAELPESASRAITYGSGAVSILAAFRIANILRSNFARTGITTVRVNSIAVFFFNAFYLQYVINRAAEARPLGRP